MPREQERNFPPDLLVAQGGSISMAHKGGSVLIALRPFTFDDEDVSQTLEINRLRLPVVRVEELAGKQFSYPPNPQDGSVETSMYLWGVHNPIDVLGIHFGAARDGSIEATFEMRFAFSFEGCCEDLHKTLAVWLKVR